MFLRFVLRAEKIENYSWASCSAKEFFFFEISNPGIRQRDLQQSLVGKGEAVRAYNIIKT
jgi:hypothetical protein